MNQLCFHDKKTVNAANSKDNRKQFTIIRTLLDMEWPE